LFGLGALIEAQAKFSEARRTNSFRRYWRWLGVAIYWKGIFLIP
jgi:hypothetical protein